MPRSLRAPALLRRAPSGALLLIQPDTRAVLRTVPAYVRRLNPAPWFRTGPWTPAPVTWTGASDIRRLRGIL